MQTTFSSFAIGLLTIFSAAAQTAPNWAEVDSLFRYGEFQRVLDATDQVLAQPTDNTQRVEALLRRGMVLLQQQKIMGAITLQQAYGLATQCQCIEPKTQALLLYWNGVLNAQSGRLGDAEKMFREYMEIQEKRLDASAAEKSFAHQGMSILWHFKGRSKESIAEAYRALEILNPSNPSDSLQNLDRIATCYNLIGNNLATFRDSTAISYFQQAEQMCYRFYGKTINPQSGRILYSIGRSMIELGKFGTKTEQVFSDAIKHFTIQNGTDKLPAVASAYSYLGICRYAQKDFKAALDSAEKALAIGRQTLWPGHNDLAAYQKEIAQALEALGRYEEAAVKYKAALAGFGYRGDASTVPKDYLSLSGTFEVLASCTRLNETLYRNGREKRFLDSALVYGNAAKDVFYSIRDEMLDAQSVLDFTDRAYLSLEHIIRVFLLADSILPGENYGSQAYNLVERFQGFILLKARLLPLSERESGKITETAHLTLPQVRNELLAPDQTLLQYFIGGFDVYLFILRRDTFAVRKISNFSLDTLCYNLREGITGYHKFDIVKDKARRNPTLEKNCNKLYMRAARELYRHLLAPAESMLRTGDTLIIVPDGALASIPFEALLTNDNGTKTDNPQFNSLPYLFRNHPVRYGWSATSLQEMSRPKLPYPDNCRGAHDFLGVAAFNEDSWTVKGKPKEILKWSGHTVSDILSLFGNRGDFLGAGGAQKSIFLQKAPCARFLHLSTHAKADDRDTYIAFAPNGEGKESELLTLEDIYNSSLPRAEVVTLGACETGSGKLGKGEGYLSIGRAFAYAGAKSIVFTLWEVKETSSREVLGNFYEELIGKGKSKTEALTAAKRRMLGNWSLEKLKEKYSHPSSNPITNSYVEDWAHPYFWSGFVLAGDGGEVSR